jgi:hypothetical protein
VESTSVSRQVRYDCRSLRVLPVAYPRSPSVSRA